MCDIKNLPIKSKAENIDINENFIIRQNDSFKIFKRIDAELYRDNGGITCVDFERGTLHTLDGETEVEKITVISKILEEV